MKKSDDSAVGEKLPNQCNMEAHSDGVWLQ